MADKRRTRELESFSPKVLAEFIRENVPMLSKARADKVFTDLVRIEARQRMEEINKEIDRLIAKGKSLHGGEHVKEYLAIGTRIDALWREHEDAMNVAFPREEEDNGQNQD